MNTRVTAISIIEILIVMAIITLITTVGVPIYKDYVLRAKVMEAFTLVDGIEVYVTKFYYRNNRFPLTAAEFGHTGNDIGKYVQYLKFYGCAEAAQDRYVVGFRNDATLGPLSNKEVLFRFSVENNTIKQYCSPACCGTGVPIQYLPDFCYADETSFPTCTSVGLPTF